MLAEVYKRKLYLAGNFFVHLAADANAPGLRNRFETSRKVDAIAVDAGVVKDNVALVDPNAELHQHSLRHRPLDCHRALDRFHDTAELSEDPTAGGVNDAAAVPCGHGEYDGLIRLQVANRAGLIRTHGGAVTNDSGRRNGCQPADKPWSSPAVRPRKPYPCL